MRWRESGPYFNDFADPIDPRICPLALHVEAREDPASLAFTAGVQVLPISAIAASIASILIRHLYPRSRNTFAPQ